MDVTRNLVAIFQVKQGLRITGEVNNRTAGMLNAILEELGVFCGGQTFQISGRVIGVGT